MTLVETRSSLPSRTWKTVTTPPVIIPTLSTMPVLPFMTVPPRSSRGILTTSLALVTWLMMVRSSMYDESWLKEP
ncbi:hypothetical protein DSECCO2_598450 [anaerobic digester metagenome]